MNWKSFLAATMLAALMLALMFIPMSGSQTSMPYDPWADINGDGKIDMRDIGYTCRLFGTTGDPTKNVSVGYRWDSTSYEIEIPAYSRGEINITTAGYRQITIHLYAYDVYMYRPTYSSYHYCANVSVRNAFLIEKIINIVDRFYLYFLVHINEPKPSEPALLLGLARTYTITGPIFNIGFSNYWNYFSVRIRVEVYLTA